MDIINVLMDEHQRVTKLMQRLDDLGSEGSQEQLAKQLVQELSLHEGAEELSIWPALRDAVGASVVDKPIQQEVGLKGLLEEIPRNLADPQLLQRLTKLRDAVMAHLRTEQDELFPILRDRVEAAQRDRLGDLYQEGKADLLAQMARLNVIMAPELPTERPQRM
jgi:hemerythrin-like domain-containing protein